VECHLCSHQVIADSCLSTLIFNYVFHENYALVKISTRKFHLSAHYGIIQWSQMNTKFQTSHLKNDINIELIKIWDDFNYACFIVTTKTSQSNKRLCARFLIYNFVWQPQVQGIFLDAFTKLRRATISLTMSSCVCLTVSISLSIQPHGITLFMKTDI